MHRSTEREKKSEEKERARELVGGWRVLTLLVQPTRRCLAWFASSPTCSEKKKEDRRREEEEEDEGQRELRRELGEWERKREWEKEVG